MKAMMLTAGLGTRLRPVTNVFAKPVVPFLNIPLLCYPLELIRELGIDSIVLNTHYKPEQVSSVADRVLKANGFSVSLSHEPGEPLGSGGGIWQARDRLRDTDALLVSNGDEVILPLDKDVMGRFLDEHRKHDALATILVMEHPLVGKQFGGVWTAGDGRVLGFGKDRSQFPKAKTGYHYIGLLLLSPRIFEFLPEGESNILYDALTVAIAKGESVRAFVGRFTWFETGNPHDFLSATKSALALLSGGIGEDAATLRRILQTFGSNDAIVKQGSSVGLVAKGAAVDSSAKLEGAVVVGAGCSIGAGARVIDSVLLPGARVSAGAQVSGEIVLPV